MWSSGTVVIPQGAASAVITVTPIDDEVFDEENDFVSITLVTGGYCLGATTQAVADIQDNDQAYKWGRFVNIRFDGYDRSPLTNFPLLVVFGPHRPTFSYADFASDEGYDLRFTAEGRKAFLNHEIEEWNTNGDSYVWVQVPVLSNGSYITAYWGNADRTNVPGFAANTWSEGYAAVWHLAEDVTDELADGTHLDSSGRENHGAQSYNGPIAGIVSGAQSFDGMNDQINCGNGADLSQPGDKTLSAWICPDTIAGERGLASKWGNSWCWVLGHDGTDLGRSAIYFDGWRIAGSVVATSAWTQVAVVYDDDLNSVTFYRNGVIDGAAVEYWGPGTDGDLTIGQRGGGASWFDGSIDETRISNVPRSSDWIWATWLNIASNDTFCAFGCVTSWGGTIIQLY
jgi:hypothetical protein